MPYRDKNKQREAVRQAVRKHRAKGITKVLQPQGITVVDEEPDVIPEAALIRAATRLEPTNCKAGCNGCSLLSYRQGYGMSCPRGKHSTSITAVFEESVNPYREVA